MNIDEIIDAIRKDKVRITDHADEETQAERLTFDQVFFSVLQGEVIEEYPHDRPYPSCLIFGNEFGGKPIHSVWAYNSDNGWTVLITVYVPDPERWIDWRTRRK
ncbi:MAG: DUF4258 domain-containing protein [Chloroflexota bacterium]|nr:DUF4258 domain-containing protein [Chloroflexota bacterium]